MAEAQAPIGEEDLELSVPSITTPGTKTTVSSETALTLASLLMTIIAVLLARVGTGIDLVIPAGMIIMAGLGYVEGSNSIGEGVATLVGGDVASVQKALAWGSVWSAAGCAAAFVLASALLHTFTHDFFVPGTHPTQMLGITVMVTVLIWMTVATRVRMPVSANHSTAGALVGAAMVAVGVSHIRWESLVGKVIVPIALSPVVAAVAGLLLFWLFYSLRSHLSQGAIDRLHWLSSAGASFSKGLNQAPKIAAMGTFILLSAHQSGRTPFWVFGLIAFAMGLGSFLGGTRVTRTLANDLTDMDRTQAFTANLTTALLVGVAAHEGLPVSDAQVGSGAISGVGMLGGLSHVNWSLLRTMLLTWVVTAPISGILAGLLFVSLYWLRHGTI